MQNSFERSFSPVGTEERVENISPEARESEVEILEYLPKDGKQILRLSTEAARQYIREHPETPPSHITVRPAS